MSKYESMDNFQIIQELSSRIMERAILDSMSKNTKIRQDAFKFFKSEYCEFLCFAIGIEFSSLQNYIRRLAKVNKYIKFKKLMQGLKDEI